MGPLLQCPLRGPGLVPISRVGRGFTSMWNFHPSRLIWALNSRLGGLRGLLHMMRPKCCWKTDSRSRGVGRRYPMRIPCKLMADSIPSSLLLALIQPFLDEFLQVLHQWKGEDIHFAMDTFSCSEIFCWRKKLTLKSLELTWNDQVIVDPSPTSLLPAAAKLGQLLAKFDKIYICNRRRECTLLQMQIFILWFFFYEHGFWKIFELTHVIWND